MKHLKAPLKPLLPSIAIYTARPDIITSDDRSAYPVPGELSKDTPVPISYALELYAEILLEQDKTKEAGEVFVELRDGVDRIRAGYWDHRLKAIS